MGSVPLIKPFYMNILEKNIQLEDIKIIDPKLYESLTRAKENPEKEKLTFIYEETLSNGQKMSYDLIIDGYKTPVTKEVVDEYIE